MNIYVGNIAFQSDESELQSLFEKYGTVSSVNIITDQFTGRSKGFGFVEMESKDDGQDAIDNLNEYELHGRNLTVSEARPRTNNGGGGGNRGGRSNDSYGSRGGSSRW